MDVVIIEDEALAAERIQILLNEIDPSIRVKKILGSVAASVSWLTVNSADLLFCDIHLADDLSFNIFKEVEVEIPIIFVTAYDEYAIKAFEQNSVAYLLKPVNEEDLKKSLEKYHRVHRPANMEFNLLMEEISRLRNPPSAPKQRIAVTYGGKLRSIALKDVVVFYIQNKVVYLVTNDGSRYVIDDSLEHLSTTLGTDFFRVNRKSIIHIEGIREVIPYSSRKLKVELYVDVPEPILVPTEKITAFKNWFGGVA